MEAALSEQYAELHPILTSMDKEINDAMERISLREQNLNEQFSGLLNIYRTKKNELAAISEHYKESSVTLNSKTETLKNVNEEIDELKQQIEERGTQNTSGAPILKIKQALANIEKECFVMSVQIAVLEQTLIQTRLSKQYDEHLGNNDRFAFKIKSSNNHTTQVEVIRYPGQAGNLLRCGRIGYSKRQGHLPSWIFGRVQGRRSYGCCMSMAAGRT
uniref:Uncharacterized protein n=2 Tax=Meloidogyne incognita group TaxID=654580 RepID=A0A915M6V5_MELJA